MTIQQPFDLALSLETGLAFRWRRVGHEDIGQRDWVERIAQLSRRKVRLDGDEEDVAGLMFYAVGWGFLQI